MIKEVKDPFDRRWEPEFQTNWGQGVNVGSGVSKQEQVTSFRFGDLFGFVPTVTGEEGKVLVKVKGVIYP